MEAEARQQASTHFAGTYTAASNASNSSFTITTDDSPGLGLFNITTLNGTPLQTIADSLGLGSANQTLSVRLYPTGLKTATRMSFRATLEALPQVMNRGWCQTWVELDGELFGEGG